MKKIYKQALSFVLLVSVVFGGLIVYNPVYADQSLVDSQVGLADVGDVYGGGGAPEDIRVTIAKIINLVLEFLGVIFIILTIYAGFQYMTAAGNKEQTEKALSLIKNAVIGLVIILMAWGITRFVVIQLDRSVKGQSSFYSPY